MANKKSLYQYPVFWVGVVGVAIAAMTLTEPDEGKAALGKKPASKSKTTARKGDTTFTKEDETASFKAVNDQPRNAFVPIVARHTGIGSADGLANAIPVEMTGGEGNWVYTGTAETDGVPVALIENRTSGDAVFLRRGERWKSAYVVRISEYSVILKGPNGTRTLGLVDENLQKTGSAVAQAGPQGFSPARVDAPRNFRGPIGRSSAGPDALGVTPDQNMNQQYLPGNEPNNGN